jgi:hypothetical protein
MKVFEDVPQLRLSAFEKLSTGGQGFKKPLYGDVGAGLEAV